MQLFNRLIYTIMGEDILSVIFLALICIIIAGIINKLAPSGMMIPTFALVAVCVWIAYDYILLKRYKAKLSCKANKSENLKTGSGKYIIDELEDQVDLGDIEIPKAVSTCSEITSTFSDQIFSGGCLGTLVRTYSFKDTCGNAATAEQYISLDRKSVV
jgi:hypothetical protein